MAARHLALFALDEDLRVLSRHAASLRASTAVADTRLRLFLTVNGRRMFQLGSWPRPSDHLILSIAALRVIIVSVSQAGATR